jgi:hypothetical protein
VRRSAYCATFKAPFQEKHDMKLPTKSSLRRNRSEGELPQPDKVVADRDADADYCLAQTHGATRSPDVPRQPVDGPPGVVAQARNPFVRRKARYIWARAASQKGRYEVVVTLDDPNCPIIKGSWYPLPGFFDASVRRFVNQPSLFDREARTRRPRRGQG